jgi:hypothetical protein
VRWIALPCAFAAACSFKPPGTAPGDAAEDVDAPVVDAPVVDAPVTTCRARTSAAVGLIGGTNGGFRAPLNCPDDEIVVALALEMTDGPRWANRLASARATITCAGLARPAGGTYQATAGAMLVANPTICNPFDPAVSTGTTACAEGSVIVGLRASAIPVSGGATCFSNVTVICAPIDETGIPGTTRELLPIPGTNNAGLTPIEVACPAGQALRGVQPNDGCGLDGLRLLCGAVTCD